MSRAKRHEDLQEAYKIQTKAATTGAVRWTIGGIGIATIAHYSWPAFRRQTLPFKAFLVSISAVFGLVIGADRALLHHERFQRANEADVRTEARIDLSRRGLVPTETAIRKWREENEQKVDNSNQGPDPGT